MALSERRSLKKNNRTRVRVFAAGGIVIALLAGGLIWWGVATHRKDQLTEAESICAQSSETLRVARNQYDTLHDGAAAEAVKITDKQVTDATTVATLAHAYKAELPQLVACNVDGADRLREAATQIDKNTDWYKSHTASLSKAVEAVNQSHDAKTLKDAQDALGKKITDAKKLYDSSKDKVKDNKTRDALKKQLDAAGNAKDGKDVQKIKDAQAGLDKAMKQVNGSVKAKSEADRKAAEEKARKEAEAAAAAQAQASSQAQQSYTAPQQSYTPTYTAPAAPQYTAPSVPQYTAPQQTAPVQPAQPAQPSKPNTGSGPVSGGHGCNEGNCSSTPDLGYIPR